MTIATVPGMEASSSIIVFTSSLVRSEILISVWALSKIENRCSGSGIRYSVPFDEGWLVFIRAVELHEVRVRFFYCVRITWRH